MYHSYTTVAQCNRRVETHAGSKYLKVSLPRTAKETKYQIILSNIYIYYKFSVGMSNLNHSAAFKQGFKEFIGSSKCLLSFL